MGQGFLKGQSGKQVVSGVYTYTAGSPPTNVVVTGLPFTPKSVHMVWTGDTNNRYSDSYTGGPPRFISMYKDASNVRVVMQNSGATGVSFSGDETFFQMAFDASGFTVTKNNAYWPTNSNTSAVIGLFWVATD